MLTAEALLAGPRGRRLCWELLAAGLVSGGRPTDVSRELWLSAHAGDLAGHLASLADGIALANPPALAAGPDRVFAALAASVDSARYWQEPDGEDRALAAGVVTRALRPVAAAVTQAPGSAWWTSPLEAERQWYAQFSGGHPFDEPRLSGAAERVAGWRDGALRREASSRRQPAEPLGAWSGYWWSTPAMSGLIATTPARPGRGPAGLNLVEDSMGWTSARCWPLRPRPGVRVYEVDGPAAWAALVARYPFDVTSSRRHDWWRATGWTGRWLMPDYQAAARDYDAVHLTVAGYLTTAGIAVPVVAAGGSGPAGEAGPAREASEADLAGGAGARTVLAGWDPGATWWLTDALTADRAPEAWAADDSGVIPARWQRA